MLKTTSNARYAVTDCVEKAFFKRVLMYIFITYVCIVQNPHSHWFSKLGFGYTREFHEANNVIFGPLDGLIFSIRFKNMVNYLYV